MNTILLFSRKWKIQCKESGEWLNVAGEVFDSITEARVKFLKLRSDLSSYPFRVVMIEETTKLALE